MTGQRHVWKTVGSIVLGLAALLVVMQSIAGRAQDHKRTPEKPRDQRPQTDSAPGTTRQFTEQNVREIEEIRSNLKEFDPLADSIFSKDVDRDHRADSPRVEIEGPGESEFGRVLRRLGGVAEADAEEGFRKREPRRAPRIRQKRDKQERLAAALRRTEKLLDRRAGEFERSGLYDEADRLRGLSGRLRQEARRIEAAKDRIVLP